MDKEKAAEKALDRSTDKTSDKTTVLVVDDHPLMRVGIAAIIDESPDMRTIGQAGTGEEAIKLYAQLAPDIVLMDLRLPGLSGVQAIRAIRRRQPDASVVVLTTYEGDEDIHQALEAGARGYIIKGMSHDVLMEGLRRVRQGRRFVPAPVAEILQSRVPDSELSPREREVLELIVGGKSNKEIAEELGISQATVKTHIRVIFGRMGVNDRTQAAVAALQRGLVRR